MCSEVRHNLEVEPSVVQLGGVGLGRVVSGRVEYNLAVKY